MTWKVTALTVDTAVIRRLGNRRYTDDVIQYHFQPGSLQERMFEKWFKEQIELEIDIKEVSE